MTVPFLVPVALRLATEFFPLLATKLGGEKGEDLAEKVVETAAAAAGLPKTTDPSELIAAISGNAAATEKIRYEFELLNQQEHERILDDRADARAFQLKSGGQRGNIMLATVAVGLFLCIVSVFLWNPDGETGAATLALVTTIAGALLKMLSDAFAFEFGSSRGSKNKEAQIEMLQKNMMDIGRAREKAELAKRDQGATGSIAAGSQQIAGAVRDRLESAGQQVIGATGGTRNFVQELRAGTV